MIAYKAFNNKLQSVLGGKTMTMEIGKTYVENEAKCSHNGFHCTENPLDTLDYYQSMESRFVIVKAEGEINQDAYKTRISCTQLTLVKEISRVQLGALACEYLRKYPDRDNKSRYLAIEDGIVRETGDFIIVRGKHPNGKGVKGSYVFLLKERKNSNEIEQIYPFYVDGKEIKANKYYGLRGDKLCEKKS